MTKFCVYYFCKFLFIIFLFSESALTGLIKPIQSYINHSALTLQYSQIHTTSCVSSKDHDKSDQKSTIGCDANIDWIKISENDARKYKYWEPSNIEDQNQTFYDTTTDFNNLNIDTSDDLDIDRRDDLDIDRGRNLCNNAIDNRVENLKLTHTDQTGELNMVDIGEKSDTTRTAIATGVIYLGTEAFQLVKENKSKKGDVLTVAKLAGITGAKKTSDLIPLCHNIPLSKIDINIEFIEYSHALKVTCLVKTHGKTGVEMEAITGVAMTTVTIYDMCKAVTKDMVISDIKLEHKSGGKSGEYNLS